MYYFFVFVIFAIVALYENALYRERAKKKQEEMERVHRYIYDKETKEHQYIYDPFGHKRADK